MGSHLIDGKFQSDKYPSCPAGKVPLSTADPMAQELLWEYAQRRRLVDPEFSDDLEEALRIDGFQSTTLNENARLLPAEGGEGLMVENVERLRCLVRDCQNYRGQGTFIGDLCAPCHEMITTGRVHHANITFIGDLSRKNAEWEKRFAALEVAQTRAIEAYKKAHPDNELDLPDMPTTIEWVLGDMDRLRRVLTATRGALIEAIEVRTGSAKTS